MALADFLVTLVTFVAVYSLFGLGLNVKYGYTGLIDFGHVAYFMVGAYVAAVLTMPPGATAGYDGITGLGLPMLLSGIPFGGLLGWFLGVLGGMVAAALVSLLVGVPTLRLREDYLAITALGIATIVNAVFTNEVWLFNGPFGIQSVYKPAAGVFPLSLGSFTVNMLVFGGLSLLVIGYVAYQVGRYVRGVDLAGAGLVTLAVLSLAGGIVVVAAGGTAALLGGLALLAVGGYVGREAMRRTTSVEKTLAVGVVVLFALWYVVQPVVTGSNPVVELQKNLMFLFDPVAGPNGGLDYDRFLMLLSVGMLAVAYVWVQRTVNSPYGRVLRAVRDDEDVPKALGKETFRYKVQSLMFGSALAGAAGALWGVHLGFISPEQFASTLTFFAFTAVIIGGTANNRGVILGTAVFWAINSGTQFLNAYFPSKYAVQLAAARLILIGALLIVILYYRPEGVLGEQDYPISLGDDSGAGTNTGSTPAHGGGDGD
ncbi:branched-chain amino acid ABC transporter permease [Haloarchaeobius sp. TZWWS8]|uniref:branched-chain amino acid ABC transporter permease n=1 Tax=Haloarchaeobius sp. TZWWS8 TaxID=3446121 RepID=UPI003EBC83B9